MSLLMNRTVFKRCGGVCTRLSVDVHLGLLREQMGHRKHLQWNEKIKQPATS